MMARFTVRPSPSAREIRLLEKGSEQIMADSKEAALQLPQPKKKRKWLKRLIILVIVAGLAAGGFFYLRGRGSKLAQSMGTYKEAAVERRDVTDELSYSGTLEPADSYTVRSLVSGEILSASFEEGDSVKKDDVLYIVDSADATTSVQRAENSLSQARRSLNTAQRNLDDLNITATASGTLVELAVETGDSVSPNQTIATIRDSAVMTIELPFPADEAASITPGQTAQLIIDGSFETLSGTVESVAATDTVLSGSRIARMVKIEVNNPGAITAETTATATVGSASCAESRAFAYKAEKTVTASASGEVASLPAAEGSYVAQGQVLAVLSSDTLSDQIQSAGEQIRDAELQLDNQKKALENYTLQSPIDGEIIDKIYKQGDNLESGKELCTIFDLSYLSFIMHVDELDIKQVYVGQKVRITADAVEGQEFEGEITKVSINGTTTNGATTYPVTVRIDEMGELLPGMNVDASVIISESKDVLTVPVEAVNRGNRVLVKTGESSESGTVESGESGESGNSGIPAGYSYRDVEIGASDGDYVEIVSGLNEGDQIAYQPSSSMNGFFMMPAGGPPDGGGPEDGGPGGGR